MGARPSSRSLRPGPIHPAQVRPLLRAIVGNCLATVGLSRKIFSFAAKAPSEVFDGRAATLDPETVEADCVGLATVPCDET